MRGSRCGGERGQKSFSSYSEVIVSSIEIRQYRSIDSIVNVWLVPE
jgi:hypothetical protein